MRWTLLLACFTVAFAQIGTEPKPKAEDYEEHGRSKEVEIGAEFMIHSFSGQGQTYIAKDFLVVEVALFPPKDTAIDVNSGSFSLRINGKKQLLLPVQPQMVAASLQHSDWGTGPRMEAGGGLGGVILGRPRPTQIPGEPQPRTPTPPRVPPPDSPGGIEPEQRVPAHELVLQTALPQGRYKGPVSGFLYFPFKGKTTSIKSLDLLYEDAVVRLR